MGFFDVLNFDIFVILQQEKFYEIIESNQFMKIDLKINGMNFYRKTIKQKQKIKIHFKKFLQKSNRISTKPN